MAPAGTLIQRYIWSIEKAQAHAPDTAPMGLGMCAPMLIGCGTQEAKRLLPAAVLSGEELLVSGLLGARFRVGP